MKLTILVATVFVLCSSLTAELSESAKQAIQDAKQMRENNTKAREEQKAKNSAGAFSDATSIPGKLLYRGNIEKIDVRSKQLTVVSIRLKDGETIETSYGSMFIKNNTQLALSNLLSGMDVSIVNNAPVIVVPVIITGAVPAPVPAPAAAPAEPPKIPDCKIDASTKIYCGNDANHLEKYFTITIPKPALKDNKKETKPKAE